MAASPDMLQRLSATLGARHVMERELGPGGRQLTLPVQAIAQRLPLDVRHGEPELTVGRGTGVEHRYDVRMLELCSELDLSTEPLRSERPGQLSVEDLECNETVVLDVAREIHGRHPDDALAIAREIADGLAYAHTRGVIHRDVKPETILVANGRALLADFGVARGIISGGTAQPLTETRMALGTPSYTSPEQAAGDRTLDAPRMSTRWAACSTRCWQVSHRTPGRRRKPEQGLFQ